MSLTSNHQPEVIDELNGRTWQELTRPTKTEMKGFFIEFTPTADPTSPRAGVLLISGRRDLCRYVVCEFPTDWKGRGFLLAKIDVGTDKTEERYSCFVGQSETICECKGYQFTHSCRHLIALETLIENGKL